MKKFTKKQWIKFSIAAVLYTLFAILDAKLMVTAGINRPSRYILTHYIPWELGNGLRTRRYATYWNGWTISY